MTDPNAPWVTAAMDQASAGAKSDVATIIAAYSIFVLAVNNRGDEEDAGHAVQIIDSLVRSMLQDAESSAVSTKIRVTTMVTLLVSMLFDEWQDNAGSKEEFLDALHQGNLTKFITIITEG